MDKKPELFYRGHVAGTPFAKPDFTKLFPDAILDLVPEPDNAYDSKAIRVDYQGMKLGYIKKTDTEIFHANPTFRKAVIVSIDPTNRWSEILIEA